MTSLGTQEIQVGLLINNGDFEGPVTDDLPSDLLQLGPGDSLTESLAPYPLLDESVQLRHGDT